MFKAILLFTNYVVFKQKKGVLQVKYTIRPLMYLKKPL